MRCKLSEQVPAPLHVSRIDGYDLRFGQEHSVGEVDFSQQKLPGGAFVVDDRRESRLKESVGVPEVILERIGSAGDNNGRYFSGMWKSSVEGVDGEGGGNSWRQANDDGPRGVLEKPSHGGNEIKSHHAAEATVRQRGLCAFYQGRILVDAPDRQPVLEQIVDNEHAAGVRCS